METANALEKRAQQQRDRRLARRVCGYCSSPAELMLEWGSSRPIPICGSCNSRLQGSWRELQVPENEWTGPEKAWGEYRPAGFWCDLQQRRAGGEGLDPCEDCILFAVEARAIRVIDGDVTDLVLREDAGELSQLQVKPSWPRRVWWLMFGSPQ